MKELVKSCKILNEVEELVGKLEWLFIRNKTI
jgi:hypothetical protein